MNRGISDFFTWLGGADRVALAEVPAVRSRFAQMGGVLVTTAGIAVVSMTFAMHDAVRAPWWLAGMIGVLWGFIILNLDRLLVLSIGVARSGRQMWLMAAPRLMMAAILAVVISTPLVLRIFASDINAQLFIIHEQVSREQKSLLANSSEAREVTRLQQQITADQKILAGQLPVQVTSPGLQAAQAAVASLTQQQAAAQTALNNAIEAYQCEADGSGPGCAGASTEVGQGPIFQAKYRLYLQAKAKFDSITSQLNAAQAQEQAAQGGVAASQASTLRQDQAAARAALPALENQHAAAVATLRAETLAGSRDNEGDSGLLAQIRALFAASATDPALALAHLAVFLLFFMIEILPVTVKLLLSMDKDSAYESVLRREENKAIDQAKIDRAEHRQVAEQKSQARIQVEADMRDKEIELGKQANSHVQAAMTKILDAALQQWSAQVTAQLGAGGPPAAISTPAPSGPGAPGAPGGPATPGAPGGTPGQGGSNGTTVAGATQVSTFFNLPGTGTI